jgi:Cu+-exporting ATPase
VDPVCNLDLTAMHGKFAYDFEDETYWFCSELCRDQFAAQPQKYAKRKKDKKTLT